MLSQPSDVRSNVAVATATPAVLLAGPTRLLHANFDRRAGVVFTRVSSQESAGPPDCRSGVSVAWDGASELDVGAGEFICVGAVRRVTVSWHARPMDAKIPQVTQHFTLR